MTLLTSKGHFAMLDEIEALEQGTLDGTTGIAVMIPELPMDTNE
jgi:hypothetical protein